MQKVNSSWTRLLVALVAVLVVAGPSLVFAANPGASYGAPRFGVIEGGPLSATTTSTPLSLYVTYENGDTATDTAPDVTFSVNPLAAGSISAAGSFVPGTAATVGERVQIAATYTQGGVSLHTNRIFVLTP